MPFFRQSCVVLDAADIALPHASDEFKLVPSDLDATPDNEHRFLAVFALEALVDAPPKPVVTTDLATAPDASSVDAPPADPPPQPYVTVVLEGSFNGRDWIRLTSLSAAADGHGATRASPIDTMPPHVRARAYGVPSAKRVYVSIGSTAPLRIVREKA